MGFLPLAAYLDANCAALVSFSLNRIAMTVAISFALLTVLVIIAVTSR
ncbi:MAG TPA: hypothetical protein VFG05_00150 [Methylocella sp.]|nr:hypothetical protein [Methylocella sp.]